jgi:hypothetical protein
MTSFLRPLSFVFGAVLVSALSLGGCAAQVEAPDAQGEEASEESDLSSSQSQSLKDIRAAVVGLTTSGSEGDPDPFKVTTVKLRAGEKLDEKFLTTRVFPRLRGVYNPEMDRDADFRRAFSKSRDAEVFDVFSEDAPASNVRNLQTIVRRSLTNVQGGELGYSYGRGLNMDSGAVARCIIGQLGNTVVVIWGIDIWT